MFSIFKNWKNYAVLARWDKPIGAWLLLLPCWWGMLMVMQGTGFLGWWQALYAFYFAIGALIMRSAGCVWNDIIDRKADAKVERTEQRPLANGNLSVTQALFFMSCLTLVGLIILLQMPLLAVVVASFSLLLAGIYPLMKRITHWPQAWLGLTFNWGIWVGAFALSPAPPLEALGIMYLAAIFWTLGYDTIYAMQDIKDDKLIGVKSTAILFGKMTPYWVAGFYIICHALIAVAVNKIQIAPMFWAFWGAGAVHLFWQYKSLKQKEPNYAKLFKSNRDYGLLIVIGLSSTLY